MECSHDDWICYGHESVGSATCVHCTKELPLHVFFKMLQRKLEQYLDMKKVSV